MINDFLNNLDQKGFYKFADKFQIFYKKSTKDPFIVLGINPGSPFEEAKSAFRDLAKKFHPDVNNAPDAHTKFVEINNAFSLIKEIYENPEFLKHYLNSIKKTEPKEPQDNSKKIAKLSIELNNNLFNKEEFHMLFNPAIKIIFKFYKKETPLWSRIAPYFSEVHSDIFNVASTIILHFNLTSNANHVSRYIFLELRKAIMQGMEIEKVKDLVFKKFLELFKTA